VRYLQGIKALFEDIDLKTEVFEGLDELSPKEGILATAGLAGMTYRWTLVRNYLCGCV
jgi:hypothetical protein